jgi:hypothetical protein
MKFAVSVGISVSCLMVALEATQAANLYVSTQGSDSGPGTSDQPFRTITHAYSLAGPGVTILVASGVYTDYQTGWGIHLGASGTASSPIILRSQVQGGAVIDGQNASDRNVGFYIDGSYNIVDGFEIRNGPKGGITLWANNNQILNCNIHDNGTPASSGTDGRNGIYSSENTSGNLYAANYIHNNGRAGSNLDHGLYLCGDNEVVINNVVFGNMANGLQIAGYTTVSNMKICNNVFAYNGANGIILWQALSGVDIQNNIIYKNGHSAIGSWDAHGSGVTLDHNLSFGNAYGNFNFTDGGSDYSYSLAATIYADPNLADETSSRFDAHLTATSPAIQAGVNLSSSFTTDMTGNGRPSSGGWDLGAYVFGSVTAPPGISTVSVTTPIAIAVIGTTNYGAFTFSRTGDTSSALTVNYSLGGTAVKWNDYYSLIGGDMPVAVTIPSGAASYTMNIVARTNQTGANPEYVTLTLSPDPSYQVGSPSNATITIIGGTSTPPPKVSIQKVASGINIAWTSVLGKVYRVAYKNGLAGQWSDLTGNITASAGTTSWTDTTSAAVSQRFYTVYATN